MRATRPFRGAVVAAAASACFVLLAPPASSAGPLVPPPATDLLPDFLFVDEPLPEADLQWNPTGERIFPSVIRAADYLEDPLGEYYLYYAPHERPGGIALAYADDLDGPWTEYAANPLVSNVWQPYYSVSHVSSPHVIWNEEEQRLFLFFHGENDITKYATSADGVTWTYGGRAISRDGTTGHETSYARVYERQVEGMDNRYLMTFMDNVELTGSSEARRIRWAVSDDMRTWEIQPEPLVRANTENRRNASGAYLLEWRDRVVVAYHGSDGDMWASEVGPALDQDVPLGRIHEAMDASPDRGRSAAPTFFVEGDRFHVFYEAGSRLTATIAHAVGKMRPQDHVERPLECTATPSEITPSDRRWVDVSVSVKLSDGTLGPLGFELVSVDAGRGPAHDIDEFITGTPDTHGRIRASHATDPAGRTFTLEYRGHDEIGRPAACTVEVHVPFTTGAAR